MKTLQDSKLVARIEAQLRAGGPLMPELRSEVLRLPSTARRDCGLAMAEVAARLIRENAVRWRPAVIEIGAMLKRIETSLRGPARDAFERTR